MNTQNVNESEIVAVVESPVADVVIEQVDVTPSEDVLPSVLQRAVDQGLKVTADGRIILPGSLSDKEAKVKAPKAPKTPAAPKEKKAPVLKEFKGISSKIFSTGDTIDNVIDGLTLIKSTMESANIDSPYKISTYKNELRVAFDSIKGAEFIGKMDQADAILFNEAGWTSPEKKDFLMVVIA